jgi:hypothetical protein
MTCGSHSTIWTAEWFRAGQRLVLIILPLCPAGAEPAQQQEESQQEGEEGEDVEAAEGGAEGEEGGAEGGEAAAPAPPLQREPSESSIPRPVFPLKHHITVTLAELPKEVGRPRVLGLLPSQPASCCCQPAFGQCRPLRDVAPRARRCTRWCCRSATRPAAA